VRSSFSFITEPEEVHKQSALQNLVLDVSAYENTVKVKWKFNFVCWFSFNDKQSVNMQTVLMRFSLYK